jgi:hypothetical protein
MSASPWRDDNQDLVIEGILGKRIVEISASFLIERGYLVKPIIRFKEVPRLNGLEKTYPAWSVSTDINCMALNDSSIYIDAHFTIMPCCIIASWLYTSYDAVLLENNGLYDESTTVNIMGAKIKKQVFEIIEELGGFDAIDARTHGIQSIVDSSLWQTIWHDKWENGGSLTCGLMCSSASPFISLQQQIIND